MTDQPNNFNSWLATPLGQYMLRWEKPRMDKAVEDIFGYNALQLGLPSLYTLENSRIPNRWLALDALNTNTLHASSPNSAPPTTLAHQGDASPPPTPQLATPAISLYTSFHSLPFPEQSIDLVILPHTLDLSADPHATLREVTRVLVPEGKVVITCINPTSLWGLLQRRVNFAKRFGEKSEFLPLGEGALLNYWRLRDWMRLLNLEICAGSFGCYRPAFKKEKWLNRTAWMEKAGDRWWPILGATYQITATKRIQGVRIIAPAWKKQAQKEGETAIARTQKQSKQQNPKP